MTVKKKKLFPIFILLSFYFLSGSPSLHALEVTITGTRGEWEMQVDGEPFYILGAGCGMARGKKGEDYLALAKAMGANSVRTWGTDQGDRAYLDRAAELGLKVAAGIWINWADPETGHTYIGESETKREKTAEALAYVRRFKEHPAILMWNVGNEALHFTENESERVALAQFLEELIRRVKAEDPSHPVIYAAAGTGQLPLLKEQVPSLDVIGVNAYGSIRQVDGSWEQLGFEKPYVLTEFGPPLPQSGQRDAAGKPIEPHDHSKAMYYRYCAEQVFDFKGNNLGGYAFHLGETTQDSLTWWNLNHGELKNASFWAVRKAYTGEPPLKKPPRVLRLLAEPREAAPGETVRAEVVFKDPEAGLSVDFLFSTATEGVLRYYVNEAIPAEITERGGTWANLKAPADPGIYRLYGFVRDEKGNIASVNKTIRVRA